MQPLLNLIEIYLQTSSTYFGEHFSVVDRINVSGNIMVRNKSGLFARVQMLIDNGVKSCAIIQSPDWNGGHNQSLCFSNNEEEDWYDGLGDFQYVEWTGRPIDLLKDDPWLESHKEPLHEEPYDSEWPWWEEFDEPI